MHNSALEKGLEMSTASSRQSENWRDKGLITLIYSFCCCNFNARCQHFLEKGSRTLGSCRGGSGGPCERQEPGWLSD